MDLQQPQTILITGAGGFLGNELARYLLHDTSINIKDLVLSDIIEPRTPFQCDGDKRIIKRVSDLSQQSSIDQLFDREYSVICALHGLMSGGSEADFEGGLKANLYSTQLMLEKIRAQKYSKAPVFLFTSSGAVFGGPLPDKIYDDFLPAPQGSYGTQKLICEFLCFDYSRKGYIDARSVRLPTIIVRYDNPLLKEEFFINFTYNRPGKPNTALSSYASGIVREPLKGQSAECPVALDFPIFVSSPKLVITNFILLLKLPADRMPKHTRTVNLPGITVTTQEILEALEKVGGKEAVKLVNVKEDPAVKKIVDTWAPTWDTQRAYELGLQEDPDVLSIVKDYKAALDVGQG